MGWGGGEGDTVGISLSWLVVHLFSGFCDGLFQVVPS